MVMRVGGVAIVLVCACGTIIRPPDPDRRLDVRVSGSLFESDRGYQFVALPEPGASLVQLDVRIPVGSADDPPGKEGLAHLVEHLLFDVELPRASGKTSVSAELGRVALSWNAETHADHTTYTTVAAASALDELIGLEADRVTVGCAGLTRAGFERTRAIVIEELRERLGASGDELQRLVREAVYPPGHRYRGVDSVDSVGRLAFEDACAFLVGPYRRGRAIVTASGAVDGATLQAAAARHLGRALKRTVEPPPSIALAPAQPGTVRLRGDVDEPTLLVTWPLPTRASREYRLLELAWPTIAPRFDSLAFAYHWGHSASATIIGGGRAPALVVSIALTSASKLGEAVDAIERSTTFGAAYLGENRDDLRWTRAWHARAESLLTRWESLAGRNALYADVLQDGAGSDVVVARLHELDTAEPGEARALAERWLAAAGARRILIEPSGTVAARRAALVGGDDRARPHDHATQVDGTLADRPLPLAATRPAVGAERYTLDNGLRVILWPHGSSPVVHGRLVIRAGTAHEPTGRDGMADLLGADSVEPDSLVFDDRALASYVDGLVGALARILRRPGHGLSYEGKRELRERLERPRTRARTTYARAIAAALYGERHPYAHGIMTAASLEAISRDGLMGWARDRIVPRNATLILAGRFDAALIKRHIAFNADQVPGGSPAQPPPARAATARAWIAGEATKPSPTVELAMSFVRGTGVDRDHPARTVLAAVLDAQLLKLRTVHAVTYGFSAQYEPRHAGGLWTIGGEVDATRAAEAATALEQILERMRRDPESYRADFVLARQKVVEGLLVGSASARSVAEQLVLFARFDLPDDFVDRLARDTAALTLPQLHELVVRELAADDRVFGAFGNPEPVQAAIRASKAAAAAR